MEFVQGIYFCYSLQLHRIFSSGSNAARSLKFVDRESIISHGPKSLKILVVGDLILHLFHEVRVLSNFERKSFYKKFLKVSYNAQRTQKSKV